MRLTQGYHGEYEARAGGHASCAPAVSAALSGRQPGGGLNSRKNRRAGLLYAYMPRR